MSSRTTFPVTAKTRVHRRPERASYDRAVAHAILDEALVATVAFCEGSEPFAMPMLFARLGEQLILHAASSSRVAKVLAAGTPVCVTVTLLDGLVFARSAMHHSLNYRSVVVLGATVEISGEDAKRAALVRLLDHVLPGRSAACRPPNAVELKATGVFALPLEEVSVKRRAGGPLDVAEDLGLPYWAGVVPLAQGAQRPIPDGVHPPLGSQPATLDDYDRAKIAAAGASAS